MIINGVRQLVTIQKIDKIAKHPNADRLSIATIGLWEMITAAPLKVGDEVLFFEIDSMIPLTDSRFEFLKGRNEKTLNGVAYSRLRTMRLRGELSQGLIIPIKEFEREVEQFLNTENELDLQEILGVKKYEAPSWIARGKGSNPEIGNSFPDCVPKTDQERVQNCVRQYQDAQRTDETFEASFKLHGSSITILVKDNQLEICSRNYSLRIPSVFEWNDVTNHFISTAIKTGIVFKLLLLHSMTGKNIALQGELFGVGINKNFEGIEGLDINIFDVYDIDAMRYLLPKERMEFLNTHNIKSVPIYDSDFKLPENPRDCLLIADGDSAYNGKFREGLVFKSNIRDFSFKAVSNRFLEETGE